MNKRDFYYDLPQELIAQTPAPQRDMSRLLCVGKSENAFTHRSFSDLPDLLREGDLLVLNNSKVIPARLHGVKIDSSITCEILLLKQLRHNETECVWECMVHPGRRLTPGASVSIGDPVTGDITAFILETLEGGNRAVRFTCTDGDVAAALTAAGEMPLPPYITAKLADSTRYNTVYAEPEGSVAAPTAGLHFTTEVFEKLAERGIDTAFVTLHVGAGTFRPVKTENIDDHVMHSEIYHVPVETIDKIAECKQRGGRVIAVGTTAVRTLESAPLSQANADIFGETNIFIRPGYKFRQVDGMVTNFHLPESTLIMLVSAFCTREKILAAYEEAIRERYRFFSFGDAMLIL